MNRCAGIEPGSPTLWADALLSEPPGNTRGKASSRGETKYSAFLSSRDRYLLVRQGKFPRDASGGPGVRSQHHARGEGERVIALESC